jgi:energy-coupling factor transporter transmembrane protein EcfT
VRLAPVPATLLLAGAGTAALLATRVESAAAIAGILLLVCLRAEASRRRVYLIGALVSGLGVFLLSPFLAVVGYDVLWSGPTVPVLGTLDVTVEEIEIAALQALRLVGVALAFSAYALLVDHDRLVASARIAPRSALAVALATRLVPSLERDASGLRDAVRGRGVAVTGVRGHARLLSPLVGGSLERAANLAEAMEARGYGRPGRTVAPGVPWGFLDRLAVVGAVVLVIAGLLWL